MEGLWIKSLGQFCKILNCKDLDLGRIDLREVRGKDLIGVLGVRVVFLKSSYRLQMLNAVQLTDCQKCSSSQILNRNQISCKILKTPNSKIKVEEADARSSIAVSLFGCRQNKYNTCHH